MHGSGHQIAVQTREEQRREGDPMRPLQTFHVRPSLPQRLLALEGLAYNLRWSWDHDTISLFRRLDRDLWDETGHNPVLLLGTVSQERLHEVAQDESFLAHMDRIDASLRSYMSGENAWYTKTYGPTTMTEIAYFSMEFGLTESLPIYSGGLGILAGDHLKSASELGLPLIGVGLLYQKGYFRQYLNQEGWQQERYPINDFSNMPLRPCRNGNTEAKTISVDIAGRTALARLWQVQVGRVSLILLDTNIPENPRELQDITDELYGGGEETRLQQEILLGIGGMRALDVLGLRARVYHMNEGHCSFLVLERMRLLMKNQGLSMEEARGLVAASTVFTTHTPVPAGTDVFPPDMIERYFASYREELSLDREALLDLGRIRQGEKNEPFNMTALALRSACYSNGVSRLHGSVSRSMWTGIWPGVPVNEIPINHVTNGVHPGSWISQEMRQLYERYLGPRWTEEPGDTSLWKRAEQIPGEELWRTHERRRERLVAFARRRLMSQLRRRGEGKAAIAEAEEALDPEALTIGFARRFATYKRATLLLRDPDRLDKILNDPARPVQIIFAGKAHPRDEEGKNLIRQIVHLAREHRFRRRIIFLEDYDSVTSRYMVQGVDVWLNTPRRPQEASGTSGMKAAFNGALNLSIPDGWWDEAYSLRTGWAIGRGEEYRDLEYQDRVEAGTLYDILEREVAPLFYERGADGVPRDWITMMKSALCEHCPVFNTNRMVHQYYMEAYRPAMQQRNHFEEEDFRRTRALAAWREKVHKSWDLLRVQRVETKWPDDLRVGSNFDIMVWVDPGDLSADDFAVQVYLGRIDENQLIVGGKVVPIAFERASTDEGLLFHGQVPCPSSGTHGVTVRLVPAHEDLPHAHCLGLIRWAN
jgi:starch phosphorylase